MRRNGFRVITLLGTLAVSAGLAAVAFAGIAATTPGRPAGPSGVVLADTPWGDGLVASPSPSSH
ncbi:hypothetical protein [Hamadaea tsunoensis]|uniref:hypothetical protein n=1 Tax=Hamadaea tsunoensis TaxID=53368 RepID=UPI0003F9837E|nr:hypothetical protein [Hamadaea tsunoensis]